MPRHPAPPADDGHFSDNGRSFVVNRPDTSHPLINVISLGTYGVAVAQTGAGCSWGRTPSEPVTKCSPRFTRDAGGRALYLRDEKTGRSWSAGWQPLRVRPQSYECIHGVGYSLITSRTEGIQTQWLVFVPYEEPLEVWRVRIRNTSPRPRSLTLWTGIEWASDEVVADGEIPLVHGEGRILLAGAGLKGRGPGSDGVFFHSANLPVKAHAMDRRAFWGAYGSAEDPESLERGRYIRGGEGRGPLASLCLPFALKPGEERSVLFTVGRAKAQSEAILKARKFQDFAQVDHAWIRTQMVWDRYLSSVNVETPDKGFDLLVNTWLKYQALSQGLWGGRGPRDFRILLLLDPQRIRREILSRAAGDASASAPIGETPWPLLMMDYLKETGEAAFLRERISSKTTLYEAAARAIRALADAPPNDGVALSQVLSDWAEMTSWAVEEGVLPSRERETVGRIRVEASRRKAGAAPREGRGEVSLHLLDAAIQERRAGDAWEIFRRLASLSTRGEPPPLFAPERTEGNAAPPSTLFQACMEGILGVIPSWRGLRIRPCLPPAWKGANLRREFRGALCDIRIRRDPSQPSSFQEIRLNGRRVPGDLLPELFGRSNKIVVAVGRAR